MALSDKVIELLEQGKPVFSCGTIPNGNYDEILALSPSAYDMIILETEHVGFDFPTLRHSLLYLLNRKRIAEQGTLQPDIVPLVRIPPYTRERNEWVIKQTLDAGPYGLVLPHFDSVEGAQSAVRAARYLASARGGRFYARRRAWLGVERGAQLLGTVAAGVL
jgi:4-hydroxy-2-oxoheptanedioate aldolase